MLKIKKTLRLGKNQSFILFKKYAFSFGSGRSDEKSNIAFIADGLAKQGGLVDRLKGILSIYNIAKQNEIEFKIQFSSPFELNDFLVPAKVNWLFETAPAYRYPKNKPIYLIDDFDERKIQKKLLTIKTGQRLDVYYNVDLLRKRKDHADIWHTLFWELFQLSPKLKAELNQFQIPKDAIAIHIRFLNNFGDFSNYLPKESSFVKNVLNEKGKFHLRRKFENVLMKISNEDTSKKLVLFTDSNYFMNHLSGELKSRVIVVPGEIKQSEDKTKTGFDAHKKTFIDFFLMAQCSKVIMLKSQETYNSSFSKYAAIVGKGNFEIQNI